MLVANHCLYTQGLEDGLGGGKRNLKRVLWGTSNANESIEKLVK